MKTLKNLAIALVRDEKGGEVLEYALIAGLIVVAAIAMIGAVGDRVFGAMDLVEFVHVRSELEYVPAGGPARLRYE